MVVALLPPPNGLVVEEEFPPKSFLEGVEDEEEEPNGVGEVVGFAPKAFPVEPNGVELDGAVVLFPSEPKGAADDDVDVNVEEVGVVAVFPPKAFPKGVDEAVVEPPKAFVEDVVDVDDPPKALLLAGDGDVVPPKGFEVLFGPKVVAEATPPDKVEGVDIGPKVVVVEDGCWVLVLEPNGVELEGVVEPKVGRVVVEDEVLEPKEGVVVVEDGVEPKEGAVGFPDVDVVVGQRKEWWWW